MGDFVEELYHAPVLGKALCVACGEPMSYVGVKYKPEHKNSPILLYNHRCNGEKLNRRMGAKKAYQTRLERGDFMWGYGDRLAYGFNIGGRNFSR